MKFLKFFFNHDHIIIGLCGLKKTKTNTKIIIPSVYTKTTLINTENNYLLFE